MKQIKKTLSAFLADEEGASGIEYALIAAMVAVAIAFFVEDINTSITTIFTDIKGALTTSGS